MPEYNSTNFTTRNVLSFCKEKMIFKKKCGQLNVKRDTDIGSTFFSFFFDITYFALSLFCHLHSKFVTMPLKLTLLLALRKKEFCVNPS